MLIPQPPLAMHANAGAEYWITMVVGSIAAISLIFAITHWARSRRPVLVLLYIAGGAMAVFEPMVDTVGGCWFPLDSWVGFSAWGRPLPVWLCLTYFTYFGIGVGLIWMAMSRGITRAQVWGIFMVSMLADVVLEQALLLFDPYVYYGWQPLRLGKFPLWWAPVNALVPLVAAAAVYRLQDRLQGWRQILIIPMTLTASAAVNAGAGWPSWLVINTDTGPVLTQLGGLASFALAFWCVGGIADWVAKEARGSVSSRAAPLTLANS